LCAHKRKPNVQLQRVASKLRERFPGVRLVVEKRNSSELGLWPHQLKAVNRCEAYFASGSTKGCLVHMPTGTGKTGVMATLASRRAARNPVLVVCPSAALVAQLRQEFRSEFWKKVGAPAFWRPDQVVQALPGSIDALSEQLKKASGQRIIVVATIQAVQQIYAAGEVAKLHKFVGTVLFDEGHREPAPSWAKVIRSFAVPTVLFSATPFRGDLKVFDIDDNHIDFLSFTDAVNQALIRGVIVEERPLSDNPELFAKQIIDARDKLIAVGTFDQDCKVIVRAASEDTVSDLFNAFVAALGRRDDGVLAMHINFADSGPVGAQRRRDVPNLKQRTEKFLIHQFMLVEGIDDPACTILAVYEPFTSTRMLVQQVGRLTRQPLGKIGDKASPAMVLARKDDGVSEQWKSFLQYDKACIDNGGKPPLRKGEEVFQKLVAALPEMDYVEGKFRKRINLEEEDLSGDLRFPKAAVVYETEPGFDLDEFRADVSALLEEEDRLEHRVGEAGDKGHYHVSLGLTQTPFLADSLFQVASLEITIYATVGRRLYFYDSAGLWIDELEHIGARVGPKVLHSLLPENSADLITFMAVKNTDIGPTALRSRTLSARSLARSGVFMGEHMNVITRATGWADKTRRTVGFSRSRVRDGEGYGETAKGFSDWCEEVDQHLASNRAPAPMLSRFALPGSVPADTTPINILIDLNEIQEQFTSAEGEVKFDTEGLCVDITPDTGPQPPAPFRFELTLNGAPHTIWIRWDSRKKKYWLTSSTVSKIKTKTDDRISLTKRLNQLQAFRVITSDCRHAYVDGAFYTLDLRLADPQGAGRMVLDLITPIDELAGITSEKGTPKGESLKTWRAGSLFRYIDDALTKRSGSPAFGLPFPSLVCDDLATEAGDFIGVDPDPSHSRVVFVVAKHKSGNPGVSTSAFYDVSGQALKNLAYLKSDGQELPGSPTKFDQNWKMTEEGKTDYVPRKRAGPGSIAFRRLLARTIRTPGTERTLWLVCAGGMLSKAALEREFRRPKPRANVLQFYHLVVSAYSACQSVGVGLKIFCAE